MTVPSIRKEMPSADLTRDEFARRFRSRFYDPNFAPFASEIDRLLDVTWNNYQDGRKSPINRPAGPGYADPSYEISDEWRAASEAIKRAEAEHRDPAGPTRILIINGAMRTENTCPGETSKTFRLAQIARLAIDTEPGVAVETLDLSRLTSEYERTIYPCKTCVSTAMPLCHWPCSCYPNHSLGQVNDWMNEIYPMWVRAHGVMILCPVNWYQAPSGLKLMIDRLVCADGGNPDPTSTHGKKAAEGKALEKDWTYPRHLAGRAFSVVAHGDSVGAEGLQHNIADWLTDMRLVPAAGQGQLARFIGYMEPYATSHEALDRDADLQEETRNAARSLAITARALRAGMDLTPGFGLEEARPK